MGLFGKSKKEREKEYMNRLDVPLCLKEDFELIIDDVFTIMGVGTVATGNISTGMCREGENACVGLRGVSKEQLEKGDRVIIKNANMYGM